MINGLIYGTGDDGLLLWVRRRIGRGIRRPGDAGRGMVGCREPWDVPLALLLCAETIVSNPASGNKDERTKSLAEILFL